MSQLPAAASEPPFTEVLVLGAGAVGLSLAIALAQAGVVTRLVGSPDLRPTGRTVALLEGSVTFLTGLGVWPRLKGLAEPLAVMRIVDDTGSLLRGPPVTFRAADIGRACFGYNVENHRLVSALAEAAATTAGLSLRPGRLERFEFGGDRVIAAGADGASVAAHLLIAADGRRSSARQAAGIPVRERAYPQDALTMTLRHDRPHGDVSTEFHTRQGPFTLVPLPGTTAAPHRSSLVWVMTPGEADRRAGFTAERLARDVERQSRMLLGRIAVEGAVGRFPIGSLSASRMTGQRIALAGETAHALAPIGAQGLNLSFRDAATLAELLGHARRAGLDLGSAAVLDRYGRVRAGDVAMRAFGVDRLNRALLDDRLPTDLLRSAGLLALGTIAPLRRLAMRQGLTGTGERDG